VRLAAPAGAPSASEEPVNPIGGAPSVLASVGGDAASSFFPPGSPWPGLDAAAAHLGVILDPVASRRLGRYRDLLQERNRQFNLTAIHDPHEIERRLFLDALAMIPSLDGIVGQRQSPGQTPRLIDVGSGAGFPGLVLKIVRPQLDVTLIDATAKKVGILAEVIADLQLEAVHAVHGRAEELGQDRAYRQRFDVATARAVAVLPVLLEYVVPFLDVGGVALLPKGVQIADELRQGRRAAAQLGAQIVATETLPVGATRLVVARKVASTPAAYPRRIGAPSQTPLGVEP
jgi:16S rRNA (guanine527-N7)-methyltransferase